MSQTVRGVIARSKGQPVELVDIVVPDPGPGEVVVAVHACGVCHTDLTYREGGINDSYPFLLGHEAAGVVESIGEGVTQGAPGGTGADAGTGGRGAASAGPASAAGLGTASTPSTPPRK